MTIKTVNGETWIINVYTLTSKDNYVNFVFSMNTGTPQSQDINNINKTSYLEINTTTDSQGHYTVENVTNTITGINTIKTAATINNTLSKVFV